MAGSKFVLFLAVCASSTTTLSAFTLPGHVTTLRQSSTPSRRIGSSRTQLWSTPKALATEGDWTAYLDEDSTGLVYYFNGQTGESRWEPPTSTFPIVFLPEDMRRKAEVKRLSYIRKVQTEEREKEAEELKLSEEIAKVKAQEEEKANWFDFLFEDDEEEVQEKKAEVKTEPQKAAKEESGWFDSLLSAPADAQKTEEPEPEKNEWLSNILSSSSTAEAKAEEKKAEPVAEKKKPEPEPEPEPVPEPVPEPEPVAEKPDWFSGIFKSPEEGEEVKEEAPAVAAAVVTKKEKAPVITKKEKVPEKKKKIEVVEPEVKPIKLEMATCVLPHPSKVFWGGEDAVFTAGRTFGVFDGVSGAFKMDGVPLYSKTLASEMKKQIREDKGLSVQDMQKYLEVAREIADKKSTGASTALIASITEDGFLRALNVGDSTCCVIRGGRVVRKTKEISHYFECPYQLSVDSPDKPRDGTRLNLELVRGDLIVMGSDGVFDNLADSEIVETVGDGGEARLGQVAKKLADRSRKVSLNKKAATPYAKLAKKNGDPDYEEGLGGKVDDICCVVVRYA